jgi:hypothetical protein
MYTVCVDETLKVIAEFLTAFDAKKFASLRKSQYPTKIYFVCNPSGMIIAGY